MLAVPAICRGKLFNRGKVRGEKEEFMARLKKAFILLSIVGLTCGYSLAAFTVMPQKVKAAKTSLQNVSTAESDPEADIEASDQTPDAGIASCTPAVVVGAVSFGNPSGFFNTATTVSASWEGLFSSSTPIIKYKYRLKKVSSPAAVIIPWTETTVTDFSQTLSTPLEEGQTYKVFVKAKNGPGCWSAKINSSSQTLDTIKPLIDSFSLFQNKPYGENIILSWTASDTSGSGIKSYQLYRNGVPLGSALDKSVLSYVDTIFGDMATYSYYLVATDKAGNSSLQSMTLFATVDDVAPAAPAISYWIGGGNIVIFWPQVNGALNYELYRDGMLIYSGPEIKYTDAHLAKGQTYNYTAYALDEAGNKSGPSNTLQIYVPKPRVSTVAAASTGGQVQSATTTQEQQVSPSVSPSPSPSGSVQASETSKPSETAETKKTNWSLIIAIIIAAAIVVAGVLYWWYAREDEDEI